jgi:hypothetical protein
MGVRNQSISDRGRVGKDYVQYHNTDALKRKPTYNGKRVGIFWKGHRSIPIGSRVWLIAGETIGRTKSYWLYDWFVADRVDIQGREASGSKFMRFVPPVEIGGLPWFKEFQNYMGNFGRGLSPLRDTDVQRFEEAVQTVSKPVALAGKVTPSTRKGGGGFGNPEGNKQVEVAAVAAVRTHYQSTGWKVESVETQNCGFDLLCSARGREHHVEVKGMAGNGPPTCILTENERQCSLTDPHWQLIIVAAAIEDPVLHVFTGSELEACFKFAPLSYMLKPN